MQAVLPAQKYSRRALGYRTLTTTRQRPIAYKEVLQLEASAAFGLASETDDPFRASEDESTIDGALWYHSESLTETEAAVDLYAGRDGVVLSIRDDAPRIGSGQRLEVTGRFAPFYREGFYDGDDFQPTGQYGGADWGLYLGVGESPSEGVYIEAGPYFRFYEFDRTPRTLPNYIAPDNHFTYGGRIYLEQSTIALDRETGRPRQGYLLSIVVEREQNGSDRLFGVDPTFLSTLPNSFWRGRAKFEGYVPVGSSTLELHAEGSISDEDDRIYNYDAQAPGLGELWIDTEVRLRFEFGSLEITPLAKWRFQNLRDEGGVGQDDVSSFGAGLYIEYTIGDTFDIFADYSFLEDYNRPPISFEEDTLSEHQLFIGGRWRFGAERSF